tara:strand:+ start:1391 stop:1759 length:369 start_codon:yes stop_codon:yes gene_type:complete
MSPYPIISNTAQRENKVTTINGPALLKMDTRENFPEIKTLARQTFLATKFEILLPPFIRRMVDSASKFVTITISIPINNKIMFIDSIRLNHKGLLPAESGKSKLPVIRNFQSFNIPFNVGLG